MTTGAPVTTGRLGLAVYALMDELGLSVDDLADRTALDAGDLWKTLSGEIPAAAHLIACIRALADVIDYRSKVAHV